MTNLLTQFDSFMSDNVNHFDDSIKLNKTYWPKKFSEKNSTSKLSHEVVELHSRSGNDWQIGASSSQITIWVLVTRKGSTLDKAFQFCFVCDSV